MSTENKIEEALQEINRGTAEIIDDAAIVKLLTKYFQTGENYYVKAGFDPTAPDLHLGHTVLLQKLATFQKFGGIVQFLIGDFTAMIGDPTGKSATRKVLTKEDVIKNIESYTTQAFKILDKEKTEVVYNDDWLKELGAAGMLQLASNLTVARMLERDDFSKRYSSNTPIAVSEFMYPLLQGYDSVHLKSDIEIGGTDQKFNLLMGRQLQKSYDIKKQQAVLMMPILEGLDGIQKMSKSLGNYIGVTDDANNMFGKVLSISDDLMWRYYELLSSKSLHSIEELQKGVEDKSLHPKAVKDMLAMEIVDRFHGAGAGGIAKEEFTKIFAKKDIPTEMDEYTFEIGTGILNALVESKLVPSTSQARRDIKGGAVKIDQTKVDNDKYCFEVGEYVLQKGKKNFVKVIIK
ncbi:MAG: tyrosine--tRNA ligase [Campylobacteraceae bacterium]|jgi:tyrosyl-tRNA synthetase|nr:tyrosine--tRNA ligase [Campylobacteraceae bacterium]MBT3881647.1 tyrosine--tRNA ligase [Campylobacteraceae bacterium]MBT4029904.1 tyrosine--tRNA ligase [Campylobacteraceae bacterium]MBT4179073.1 tyrosine--tRNA ligase [Campylobacteraceae bacterium]MBT4572344.1 tyrosine--tRNA ligase [Campylobacteraceae bacterium]